MKYIVSFTTSPTRIYKCDTMVDSIVYQSVKPDLILLNIPDIFSRTGEKYTIPNKLTNKITINRCGRDWGPATKIVPTVKYLNDNGYNPNDTRIIYLDDDIKYPKTMIECLKEVEDENTVWCGSGFDFVNLKILYQKKDNKLSSIAEGYCGVCVKLSTFKDDFNNYMNKYMSKKETRLSDDIILSNYYHKVKIPIKIINKLGRYSRFELWNNKGILDYGNEEDALHNGGNGSTDNNVDRYMKVIKILNKERFFFLYTYRNR